MNIVLLDAKTLGDDLDLSALKQLCTLTRYDTTNEEETMARIIDADIVITNKVVITANMLAQTKKLKLICIATTGMNNVDLDATAFQGIEVKNVSGYSTKSVIQHTFAMALYLLEKLSYYSKVAENDRWSESGFFTDVSRPFYEISEKK